MQRDNNLHLVPGNLANTQSSGDADKYAVFKTTFTLKRGPVVTEVFHGLSYTEAVSNRDRLGAWGNRGRLSDPVYWIQKEHKDGDLGGVLAYRIIGNYHLVVREQWQEHFEGLTLGVVSLVLDGGQDLNRKTIWESREDCREQFLLLESMDEIESLIASKRIGADDSVPDEYRIPLDGEVKIDIEAIIHGD